MSRQIDLGRVFGIPIHLDTSWFFILALVAWTLTTGYFPDQITGLSQPAYWVMGVLAAVLLFVCVVLHELGHSVAARSHGIPVSRVTLFIFGGVAQIGGDLTRPRVELLVALAGPLVSLVIAGACFGGSHLLFLGLPDGAVVPQRALLQALASVVVRYLALVNTAILLFNLLPGLPLDGGRLLRAVVWAWSGSLERATRLASASGKGLGIALIVLGVFSAVQGRLVGGAWYVLLGLFLRGAAKTSYDVLLARRARASVPLSHAMPEARSRQSRREEY